MYIHFQYLESKKINLLVILSKHEVSLFGLERGSWENVHMHRCCY